MYYQKIHIFFFRWQQMIDAGEYANVHDLACALGKDFAALNGALPQDVNLDTQRNTTMDDWVEQKKFVGME